MSWFERHLNWSLFLATVVLPFIVGIIFVFIFFSIFYSGFSTMGSIGVEDPDTIMQYIFSAAMPAYLIYLFVGFVMSVFAFIVTWWYLGQKARSKWFLLLFFAPFGLIFLLLLENQSIGYGGDFDDYLAREPAIGGWRPDTGQLDKAYGWQPQELDYSPAKNVEDIAYGGDVKSVRDTDVPTGDIPPAFPPEPPPKSPSEIAAATPPAVPLETPAEPTVKPPEEPPSSFSTEPAPKVSAESPEKPPIEAPEEAATEARAEVPPAFPVETTEEPPTEVSEEGTTEARAEVPPAFPAEPTEEPPTEVSEETPAEVPAEPFAEIRAEVSSVFTPEPAPDVPEESAEETRAEVPAEAPAESFVETPVEARIPEAVGYASPTMPILLDDAGAVIRCYYHPEAAAVNVCSRCGQYVCSQCNYVTGTHPICRNCWERRAEVPIAAAPAKKQEGPKLDKTDKRKAEEEERLLEFTQLYEQALPVINAVIKKGADGLPASPLDLMEGLKLRPMLEHAKKLPKPKMKELQEAKKDFEQVLAACIKVAESAADFVSSGGQAIPGEADYSRLASGIETASGLMEGLSMKLASLYQPPE